MNRISNIIGNGNSPIPGDLISPKAACKLLAIDGRPLNLSTLHRWVYSGKLAGYRRQGRLCVSRRDVELLIRPVEVKLSPVAEDRAEKARRDLETDRTLREAGIRRR